MEGITIVTVNEGKILSKKVEGNEVKKVKVVR